MQQWKYYQKTPVKFWLEDTAGGHLVPLTDADMDCRFWKGKVYLGDQMAVKHP